MIERRWNYVTELAYDILNEEVRDKEELTLLIGQLLGDISILWEWDAVEDVVTDAVNYASKVYERKDEIEFEDEYNIGDIDE